MTIPVEGEDGHRYLFRAQQDLVISTGTRVAPFDSAVLELAIPHANAVMKRIKQFEVDLFTILGMRNLSAVVGEVYAASVATLSQDQFRANPHQDGYPDLLLMDELGLGAWGELSERRREKGPFSPFVSGGIEVKATCGDTPSPAVLAKKGLTKPGIGEQRIDFLSGYVWKAHHRSTNNLLGLLWDFIDGIPTIVAAFYSSALVESDWGAIQQPREGGGRTTSVSIMRREGIRRMYDGWLCVLADPRYVGFLNRKNQAALIPLA